MIEQWASEELREISIRLTGKQWAGIVRIVQTELEGKGPWSLLHGPTKICATSTYYGRWAKDKSGKAQNGWVDNPDFVRALELARRDYRSWLLEHGTTEAMVILGRAAAPAAREMERQVAGDQAALDLLTREMDKAVEQRQEDRIGLLATALGNTELGAAIAPLERALVYPWGGEIYAILTTAIGKIASSVSMDRQKAAGGILDRASASTASKVPEGARSASTAIFVLPDNKRGDRVIDEGVDE